MSSTKFLIVCMLAGAAVFGCKGHEDDAQIGVGGSATSATAVAPGVVNNTIGFKVQPSSSMSSFYTYHAHENGSTTDDSCSITTSAYTLQNCIFEAEELDLYFHGVSIAYNVPSTMCSYFGIKPYYYYRDLPGTGDAAVEIEVLANGTAGFITPGTHVNGNGTCALAAGVLTTVANVNCGTPVAAHAGAYPNTGLTGSTPLCDFDYSRDVTLGGTEGSNCCLGTYSQIIHTQAADGTWSSSASAMVEWGGKAKNCLRGPAMETQSFDRNGYPKETLYYVQGTGMSGTYDVVSPISKNHFSNVHAANFFAGNIATGTAPTAVLGGAAANTNPYYEFTCYDRTFEVKSRIRVQVREWNRVTEFDNWTVDASNASVNPDVGGVEAGSGEANNDFSDWEDFEGTAAPYPGILE